MQERYCNRIDAYSLSDNFSVVAAAEQDEDAECVKCWTHFVESSTFTKMMTNELLSLAVNWLPWTFYQILSLFK